MPPETYPPIGDYALIGDTLTAALISRGGSLDWLCLPDVDDPSLFAALLDAERGGRIFVGPPGEAQSHRAYVGDSAVLRTRHETAEGVLEVTDLMPLALVDGPGLRPSRHVLRLVEATAGRPEVAVAVAPRPDYGRDVPDIRRLGSHAWDIANGRDHIAVQSDMPLEASARGDLTARETLVAGDRRALSLAFTRNGPGIFPSITPDAVDVEVRSTLGWWQQMADGTAYDGPFRDAVVRSLTTLRLLTFSQSGAVIAAPTMGLPEAIGADRNYDYRYCWLRDASFVLDAFASLGQIGIAGSFFRWLMHATQLSAPRLETFYTVFGRTDIGFAPVHTLEGYRGSAHVWLGNAAGSQLQLDAYGSVMTAVAVYCKHGGHLGLSERRRLRRMADVVIRAWSLPDNGLWEMPGPRMHHTYSKVMCWAALDAFVTLGRLWEITADLAPYEQERDRIRDSVLARGWNEHRQAFTGAYGHDWLDASLALMPRFGIIDARDPRMVATFERLDQELGHGAQMRRYADGVDGIASTEGTFTACGFWAADCLARRGDVEGAEERIRDLLAHANDVGLMAEELDPATGAQLGNFPQGFSHAGLIGAAMAVEDARNGRRSAA